LFHPARWRDIASRFLSARITCHTFQVELRQLNYFVAVANEKSFTLAAKRLHVVQSAVSAAIASPVWG
jgi:hypothetical protein